MHHISTSLGYKQRCFLSRPVAYIIIKSISRGIMGIRAQKWRHLSDFVELFFLTFCPTLPTPPVTSGRWVTRAACVNYPACSTSVLTPTQPTVRGCPNPNPRVVGPPGLRGPLGYVGPSGLPMLPHRLC